MSVVTDLLARLTRRKSRTPRLRESQTSRRSATVIPAPGGGDYPAAPITTSPGTPTVPLPRNDMEVLEKAEDELRGSMARQASADLARLTQRLRKRAGQAGAQADAYMHETLAAHLAADPEVTPGQALLAITAGARTLATYAQELDVASGSAARAHGITIRQLAGATGMSERAAATRYPRPQDDQTQDKNERGNGR